ncbi:hypothetical protein [Nannocystis punicea]|uniref:Uncharacterized protein n=1 Tax=Nannocystis punicea TaxID=2995304 RepID=A0ABY7GZH1_9BACT|nr:hypothetical protein [Nannocystis poenicansa]WAS92378.1 hypothetical protein O0S08_39875 [Nannocystis poenicansa]
MDLRLRRLAVGWGLLALGCNTSEPNLSGQPVPETSPGPSSAPDPTGSGDLSDTNTTDEVEPTTTTGEVEPTTTASATSAPSGPLSVDLDALLLTFPDGCVGPGVTLDALIADGIVVPDGDAAATPTCQLVAGRGMGSRDFDDDANTPDSFPPGIMVDPSTCELAGAVDDALPFGVHAFIVTLEQEGVAAHLPYCIAKTDQPAAAYAVERVDQGDDRTHSPGLWRAQSDGPDIHYGDDTPDPQVLVHGPPECAGIQCYYAYYLHYNGLSQAAQVTASPASKTVLDGVDSFTHAIRIDELAQDLPPELVARPFVVNVTFEYCMADNNVDCGNTEPDPATKIALIRENGGGSGYAFALVVLP